MKRAGVLATGLLLAALVVPPGETRAGKPDAGPVTTSTVATGLTAEDLELARWLDVLADLELFEDLECLELMPILEDQP